MIERAPASRIMAVGLAVCITTILASFLPVPAITGQGIRPAEIGSVTLGLGFPASEFTRYNGSIVNSTAIDIPVPSSTYQIDQLAMNFTNITTIKETRTIVAGGQDTKNIIKLFNKGWGVEINVTFPTIIYGVFLEINRSIDAMPSPIYVQLRGYNSVNNAPNASIYASVPIAISTTRSWQEHTFSPFYARPGRYYLVINASSYTASTASKIYWWHNETSAQNLHTSMLNWAGAWEVGSTQNPFHYKLIQRVNVTEPESMGMKVGLNGQTFIVSNGASTGTGLVSIGAQSNTINSTNLHLAVLNDPATTIAFDCQYLLTLKNSLTTSAFVNASTSGSNAWLLLPAITRGSSECWFTMHVPSSWSAVVVRKDGLDITNITRTGDEIRVLNDTITAGATWAITARSERVPFGLNVPATEFNPGETVSLSASPPSLSGTFTFVEFNTLGIEQKRTVIPHGPAAVAFSATIPPNERAGTGSIMAVWNNATDAGAHLVSYSVVIPPPTDMIMTVVLVAAVVSGGFVAAITTYTVTRRTRRKREAERLGVISRARDLFNLQYLIVLDKASGVDLYEKPFGEFKLDPTLVSGFLSAIGSFGLELTNTDEESQTIKLEYKKSKIVMSEFKGFRITLIMKEAPSNKMIAALDNLAHDIDEKYGTALKAFNGETTEFQGMGTLIEKHLYVSFVAPLKISPRASIDLDQDERAVYNKANDISMAKKMSPFYASELFTGDEIDPKAVNALFSLMGKGVIVPAK